MFAPQDKQNNIKKKLHHKKLDLPVQYTYSLLYSIDFIVLYLHIIII